VLNVVALNRQLQIFPKLKQLHTMKFTQNVTQNGLIGGIAAVIYTFALYFMDAKMIFNPFWAFLTLLVIFPIFMTLAASGDKKDGGGYISFVEAFKSAFFAGAIMLLVSTIFSFLLQAVIDPSLAKVAKEAAYENAVSISEFFSGGELNDEQMDAINESIEKETYEPKPVQTIISYLIMALLGAIPSLIIAAFVKKNRDPLEALDEDALNETA
jgi:glucan phosphoethanolaminetransferase (alkaline phosphatase superfamily)